MGTLPQRFEVDRAVSEVYDLFAQPAAILESLPGVSRVAREMDDIYRLATDGSSAASALEIMVTSRTPYRRIEWRAAGGQWLGTVDVEPLGPERTAVTLTLETLGEGAVLSEAAVQDGVMAIKRTVQSPRVRVTTSSRQGRGESGEAKRYAAEWRDTARSAFTRPSEFPFTLMRTITKQMDRAWGDVMRGAPISRLPHMVPGLPWNPNVEVCEQNDQVRVCIEVPGIDESQLHVEIEEGYLTVRGERQDERRTDPGHRRSEFHYGAFSRRVPMPNGIDGDGARAVLRNGVLEIRIPVRRRVPHRVPVQHAPE